MNQMLTTPAADKAAISLSFACAFHCLVLPVLVSLYPSVMIAGLQERKKQVMRNISTNTAPRHQELLSQQSRLRETARAMRSGCDMTRQTLEQSEDVEVLWNITGQVEEDHIRVISGNSSTAVKSIIYGLKEFQEQ